MGANPAFYGVRDEALVSEPSVSQAPLSAARPPKQPTKRSEPAKEQPERPHRFIGRISIWITPPMDAAIKRMTGGGLFSEADVVRMTLHNALMAADPLYQRAIQSGQLNAQ